MEVCPNIWYVMLQKVCSPHLLRANARTGVSYPLFSPAQNSRALKNASLDWGLHASPCQSRAAILRPISLSTMLFIWRSPRSRTWQESLHTPEISRNLPKETWDDPPNQNHMIFTSPWAIRVPEARWAPRHPNSPRRGVLKGSHQRWRRGGGLNRLVEWKVASVG